MEFLFKKKKQAKHWQDHAIITCSIQKAQQERPDFSEDAYDAAKMLSILKVRENNTWISPTTDNSSPLLLFSSPPFFQQWVGMLTEPPNSFQSRICSAILCYFMLHHPLLRMVSFENLPISLLPRTLLAVSFCKHSLALPGK